MSLNLHNRESLPAQPAGAPTGATIVRTMIEKITTLLAEFNPESPGLDTAYDLLATWAKVKRTAPDYFKDQDQPQLDKLNSLVEEYHSDLLDLGLDVPNTSQWLRSCENLNSEAGEDFEFSDPIEYSAAVRQLLRDLDDADLVAYTARHFGEADEEFEQELLDCYSWLEDHSEFWLGQASLFRAEAQAVRADIDSFDPELATTVEKYAVLLDELELAHKTLTYQNIPGIDPQIARELIQNLVSGPEQMLKIMPVNVFRQQNLVMAASADLLDQPQVTVCYEVPELSCEIVLIQQSGDFIAFEVYDHKGDPSRALLDCKLVTSTGELLLQITSDTGKFRLPETASGLKLKRPGDEYLEFRAKSGDGIC